MRFLFRRLVYRHDWCNRLYLLSCRLSLRRGCNSVQYVFRGLLGTEWLTLLLRMRCGILQSEWRVRLRDVRRRYLLCHHRLNM